MTFSGDNDTEIVIDVEEDFFEPSFQWWQRRRKAYFGPLSGEIAFESKLNDKIECIIDDDYVYRAPVVDHDEGSEMCPLSEFEVEGKEQWIEVLIDWILNHNAQSRKTGEDRCKLYLSPFQWRHYVILQNQMAKVIPVEAERPTISLDVRVRSDYAGRHRYAFGIIGGVGQLADADILRRVYNLIAHDDGLQEATKMEIYRNMVLKIHSSSPPRPEHFEIGHLMEASERLMHYMKMMDEFLSDREIEQFLLASNTAHSNLGILKLMSKFSNPNFFEQSFVNVIESTVHVVEQTLTMCGNELRENHNILVIGTSAAYKHRIYPNALESLGLNVVEIEKSEQRNIQHGIDYIKKGELHEGGEVIVNAIRNKIENATHVVMGCSEISLAVKKETVREVNPEIIYVDTTEFMAQSVAAWLVMQNQRYRWVRRSLCGG